jgi:hypothetical protein
MPENGEGKVINKLGDYIKLAFAQNTGVSWITLCSLTRNAVTFIPVGTCSRAPQPIFFISGLVAPGTNTAYNGLDRAFFHT